jgi:hypothetical protein
LLLPVPGVSVKTNVTLDSIITDISPPLIYADPTPGLIDADVALLSVQVRSLLRL